MLTGLNNKIGPADLNFIEKSLLRSMEGQPDLRDEKKLKKSLKLLGQIEFFFHFVNPELINGIEN